MLVLTRKLNEKLIIGDNIEVTIVSVKGDRVKLGVKAPSNISVHREEVALKIQQQKLETTI